MKIPRTLQQAQERWQEKWNPGPKPELSLKQYLLRWKVPCIVGLSMLLIPAVFFYFFNMEYNDMWNFFFRSLFLIPVGWCGFWFIRFSGYRSKTALYIGLYGCLYVLANFVPLFRSRIGFVGDAYSKGRSGGGGVIPFYGIIFFLSFWFCADLLEERSLRTQLKEWIIERFYQNYRK